jgi:hypothetical protein
MGLLTMPRCVIPLGDEHAVKSFTEAMNGQELFEVWSKDGSMRCKARVVEIWMDQDPPIAVLETVTVQ